MNLNIRLLILDTDEKHAEVLAKKFMTIVPFIHHEVVGNIQHALEAHLDNPFNVSLITSSIRDEDKTVFVKDMQKFYTQSMDKLCAFIGVLTHLPVTFKMEDYKKLGYSTVISEHFDVQDQENLKGAMGEFSRFKKMNEHISDIEWTMKMILAEVDRVSSDRKRGRDTKFNKIAINFASDLVEFDTKIMDRYFDCLTEHTGKLEGKKSTQIRIPKSVLKKSLPKLVEDRYTGASSRVWDKLVQKFGTEDKKD
jgi:hypothetical protein